MECEINFIEIELKQTYEELEKLDERLFKEITKAMKDICQNAFLWKKCEEEINSKKFN